MKNKNERIVKSLSSNAKRELEVLSRYYDIDYTKCVVTIPTHFKAADEILVDCIGDKEHPLVANEFLENFSTITHSIPDAFRVSLKIKITDYQGYKPTKLLDSVQDALEVFNYNFKKEKNRSGIKMSLLIMAGIVIFAWLFYVCYFKIFGEEEITHNIIHEIIYTIACVLLWEGIYILFLPSEEYRSISRSLLYRINDIIFVDKNNKILAKRNIKEIKENWIEETRGQRVFRRSFLITATSYLTLALASLPELFTLGKEVATNALGIPLIIICVLLSVILSITAFANYSSYYGSGAFKRWTLSLNIASFIIVATSLSLHTTNALMYNRMSAFWFIISSISIIVSIIGIIGSIILRKKEKQTR